jgi:hypothetical protein
MATERVISNRRNI